MRAAKLAPLLLNHSRDQLMTYLFGLLRVAASAVAVFAGYLGWPIWILAFVIPAHAAASFLFVRGTFVDAVADLERDGASETERIWADYYKAHWLRELAFAFVKCGIAYAAGMWLTTLFAPPTPLPPTMSGT